MRIPTMSSGRRAQRWAPALAGLVLLMARSPLAGPSGPSEDRRSDTGRRRVLEEYFKFGALYVHPELSASGGYDTNVFLSREALRKGDATATFAPSLRLALAPGDSVISLTERLAYVYFHDFVSERGW